MSVKNLGKQTVMYLYGTSDDNCGITITSTSYDDKMVYKVRGKYITTGPKGTEEVCVPYFDKFLLSNIEGVSSQELKDFI